MSIKSDPWAVRFWGQAGEARVSVGTLEEATSIVVECRANRFASMEFTKDAGDLKMPLEAQRLLAMLHEARLAGAAEARREIRGALGVV